MSVPKSGREKGQVPKNLPFFVRRKWIPDYVAGAAAFCLYR